MGLIDSIFIIDESNNVIFNHVIDSSAPKFHYVLNELDNIRNRLQLDSSTNGDFSDITSGIDSSDNSGKNDFNGLRGSNNSNNFPFLMNFDARSAFQLYDGSYIPNIINLDSNWNLIWSKLTSSNHLYFAILSKVIPDKCNVYSDSEEEDDEDDDDEENASSNVGSSSQYKDIYEALEDSDEEEEEEDENIYGEKSQDNKIDKTPISKTPLEINNSENPLQAQQFFQYFEQTLIQFFGSPITAGKIESSSHNVMLILQEMVDYDFPYITDSNQLRELLPDKSILKKIINTTREISKTATNSINQIANKNSFGSNSHFGGGNTQGNIGINSTANTTTNNKSNQNILILEKSGNSIPWRRINAAYSNNEILVDLKESVSFVYPSVKINEKKFKKLSRTSAFYDSHEFSDTNSRSSKRPIPIKAFVNGEIQVRSYLSGLPSVDLYLKTNGLDFGVPGFHRCVDIPTWIQSGNHVSFIPPDDSFKLMEYSIDLLDNDKIEPRNLESYSGLVYAELYSGLGNNKDEFEIKVSTSMSIATKEIENLVIDIFIGEQETRPFELYSSFESESYHDGNDSNNKNSNNNNNLLHGHVIRSLRMTHGDLQFVDHGRYKWIFGKDLAMGVNCVFKGKIVPENQRDGSGSNNNNDRSDIESIDFNSSKYTPMTALKPYYIKVSYNCKGSLPSGIKVESLKVLERKSGINLKPFKGVKYIAEIDDLVFR
ncbi:hypothetical protein B5S28_g1578 [[Candida] boidinii]|nr:hypothetical protein B5S28_g1578 [[Candida] boidinii]OWB61119.1 hypothetical protein B5S29_g2003 [[Candida] boidinii]